MSASLQVGFFILLFLALSALFIPQIYRFLADFSLEQSGTLERIQEIDDNFLVGEIAETSEDIWHDIESVFTGEEAPVEEDDLGFFEENVYPSLVSVVAFILRAAVLILSIVGLISIVYLSYATMGAGDVERLKGEYNQLKKRVEQLEAKLALPQN